MRIPSEFSPSDRYLIGVSGGWDSMALLEGLLAAGFRDLIVCHLNHELRGEDSEADAAFVQAQAQKRGLPCEIGRVNVRARAKEHRQSLETEARNARYEFFAECAVKHDTPRLFLAHQAHDQAETVLMNLCRGAGRRGLGGMRTVSKRRGLVLIRPLLGLTRSEIPAPSAFREDASNQSPDFSRNRARLEAIPALARILERDPTINLARTAEILADEDDFLESVARETLAEALDEDRLITKELRTHHPAIQRRVIQAWLRNSGLGDVGFDDIESVRGLLYSVKPARVNLAGDRHVARRQRRLILE